MKLTLLEAVGGLLERTYRIRTCLADLGPFVIGDLGYRELYGSSRGELDVGSTGVRSAKTDMGEGQDRYGIPRTKQA